jgi:hypothetical protein
MSSSSVLAWRFASGELVMWPMDYRTQSVRQRKVVANKDCDKRQQEFDDKGGERERKNRNGAARARQTQS